MARKKNLHVVPRDGGWGVRREGGQRDSSRHGTQKDAIDAARDTARRERGEVRIHGRDGRIRDSDSYGNDPCPPKDTEH